MKNLVEKLQEIRDLEVHKKMAALCDENTELYIMGGFIRDYLLGKDISKINDADYRLLGTDYIEYGSKVAQSFGVKMNLARGGVVKFTIPDFLPIGIGFYPDANTIEDMSARADYTINSIALRINGEFKYSDDFGGIGDLENKILKEVSSEIYQVFPKRLLRGFRFKHNYNLQLEEKTQINFFKSFPAIKKEDKWLVKQDFLKIFHNTEKTSEILKEMFECGFMQEAFGDYFNSPVSKTGEFDLYLSKTLAFLRQIDLKYEGVTLELKNHLKADCIYDVDYLSLFKMAAFLHHLYLIIPPTVKHENSAKAATDKFSPALKFLNGLEFHEREIRYIMHLFLCSELLKDFEESKIEFDKISSQLSLVTWNISNHAEFYNRCK